MNTKSQTKRVRCPHASTWRLDTGRCRMGQRPVADADHSTRYGRTHRTAERCSKLLTRTMFFTVRPGGAEANGE